MNIHSPFFMGHYVTLNEHFSFFYIVFADVFSPTYSGETMLNLQLLVSNCMCPLPWRNDVSYQLSDHQPCFKMYFVISSPIS